MRSPMLQSPRTMLELVHRFGMVLDRVTDSEQDKVAGKRGGSHLPADYPFWLLLLTAMHYRLAPETVDHSCQPESSTKPS
jgi:hypothetical protein